MRYMLAVIAVAALIPSAALAQESALSDAEWSARLNEHPGDFDYLLGEWPFRANHKQWGEGAGY